MKESELQSKIIKAIKARYGEHVDITNNHGAAMAKAGTPDIHLCLFGLFVAIEVKMPRHRTSRGNWRSAGTLTPLQSVRLKRQDAALACTGTAYSVTDALAICADAFRETRLVAIHYARQLYDQKGGNDNGSGTV